MIVSRYQAMNFGLIKQEKVSTNQSMKYSFSMIFHSFFCGQENKQEGWGCLLIHEFLNLNVIK